MLSSSRHFTLIFSYYCAQATWFHLCWPLLNALCFAFFPSHFLLYSDTFNRREFWKVGRVSPATHKTPSRQSSLVSVSSRQKALGELKLSVWGCCYDEQCLIDYLICLTPQVFPLLPPPPTCPLVYRQHWVPRKERKCKCAWVQKYRHEILLFT